MRGYLGIALHFVENGKLKNGVLGVPCFIGKLGIFSRAVIKLVFFQTANIDLVSDTPIDLLITLLLLLFFSLWRPNQPSLASVGLIKFRAA